MANGHDARGQRHEGGAAGSRSCSQSRTSERQDDLEVQPRTNARKYEYR